MKAPKPVIPILLRPAHLALIALAPSLLASDSDRDGLSDTAETTIHATDPFRRDSDADGTPDGLEVANGLDPNNPAEFLERPNIIFFFVDDLGYGDVGCFWQDRKSGTQKFDTPGIDTMAAEGAKLTHHYISASVCAPSRASLLQGRHQGHCDVRNSQFDKALADNHTISSVMQRAGYRTIHVGKNGLAGGEGSTTLAGTGSQNLGAHPLDRGWDEFFGYLFHADGHEHYPRNGTSDKVAHIYDGYRQVKDASVDLYTTDAWTAYAKKAITAEAQDGDHQPFFLYLAYETPHFKMQRPAVPYPAGGGLTGGIQWTTSTDASGNVRYASSADGTGTIDAYNHPDNNTSWPVSNQQHVGMIRRIDNSITDIIRLLKDLGIDDNTLCVFSSDNGPHNEGNNPRYFESYADMEGIKRDMWEAGIRVPTVVRWPGRIAGATGDPGNIREIGYPSAIWDWMPTFADMAGITAPAWCDGVSLLPTLTGTGTQRDKGHLYFEFQSGGSTPDWAEFPNHRGETKGEMQCIRLGDLMGIRTNIGGAGDDFQIYDVTTDPGQAANLAPSRPAVQQQLKDLALQVRRPGGGVTRPYDSADVPAVSTPVEPGLEYACYEGLWSHVPEFRDLTPVAAGDTTHPDPGVRTRDDNVGILFTGYVQAPAAGSYTFHLATDTGADLFLHDGHVIADDFTHDGTERSGTINLAAGLHPIRLYYHHVDGGHSLELSWSGPGIARQAVPATAFFRNGTPPPEPTALDDAAATAGAAVDIDVLANDSDDGIPSPLVISGITSPLGGTAVVVSGSIRYTPHPGFFGTDVFRYTITDGQFFASANVSVTVVYQATDLWIPLNEVAGSSVAEAGGTLLGTMSGFADPDAARIDGVHGRALAFDGIDDEVPLTGIPASMLPTGSAPRTVMCWIRVPPATAFENQTMFGYGQNTNGNRFSFRLNGSGGSPAGQELRLEVQGGSIVGTSHLDDGQWHHVAAVCDDFDSSGSMNVTETRLYVDGNLETISSSASRDINTASGTTPMLGGSNHSSSYSFAGDIDEFRLFPYAMSRAQVQAQMNAPNQESSAWHRANFGPAAIDWSADLDGDNANRLAEYAFGGNPHLPDPAVTTPAITFNPATGRLETTFTRRVEGTHNLAYTHETSNDLVQWNTLTSTELGSTPLPLDPAFEQATFETDAASPAELRQFNRVKVELLP